MRTSETPQPETRMHLLEFKHKIMLTVKFNELDEIEATNTALENPKSNRVPNC